MHVKDKSTREGASNGDFSAENYNELILPEQLVVLQLEVLKEIVASATEEIFEHVKVVLAIILQHDLQAQRRGAPSAYA